MNLRNKLEDLIIDITCVAHHGEIFYSEEGLEDFNALLDETKAIAKKLYEENMNE